MAEGLTPLKVEVNDEMNVELQQVYDDGSGAFPVEDALKTELMVTKNIKERDAFGLNILSLILPEESLQYSFRTRRDKYTFQKTSKLT